MEDTESTTTEAPEPVNAPAAETEQPTPVNDVAPDGAVTEDASEDGS